MRQTLRIPIGLTGRDMHVNKQTVLLLSIKQHVGLGYIMEVMRMTVDLRGTCWNCKARVGWRNLYMMEGDPKGRCHDCHTIRKRLIARARKSDEV